MSDTIAQRFLNIVDANPTAPAQLYRNKDDPFSTRTFAELQNLVFSFSSFLQDVCTMKRGDHVTLICDNRPEWLVCDLAMQCAGIIDVPRGSDTEISEILFIIEHSDAKGLIIEKEEILAKLVKAKPNLIPSLSFVILIDAPQNSLHEKHIKNTYTYSEALTHAPQNDMLRATIAQGREDDIATIIYTSGTTQNPKGVLLSNKGFIFQIDTIVPTIIPIEPTHTLLSMLPVWHVYERAVQYIVLLSGASLAYSKPIGKILLKDLADTQAEWMTSVPRIWEGVYKAVTAKVKQSSPIRRGIFTAAVNVGIASEYSRYAMLGQLPAYKKRNRICDTLVFSIAYVLMLPLRFLLDTLVFKKIRALLGKGFKAGISGGGALPPHIDWFYQAAKIKIVEGYGLTETSPVLSVRNYKYPVPNSVGTIFNGIEYKVIDDENRTLPPGNKGVLVVRGVQVMKGYYKNEEGTNEVLSPDGWLNTGDKVVVGTKGEIKILGRKKATIVLLSGENVEPEIVESELVASDYINAAVVFGQDKKFLVALIYPDLDAVRQYCVSNSLLPENTSTADILSEQKVRSRIKQDIHTRLLKFPVSHRVKDFSLLSDAFEVGKELTQTLKYKRHYIEEKYKDMLTKLYGN